MNKTITMSLTALTLALAGTPALANGNLNCTSGPANANVGPSANSKADQKLNIAVLTQLENGQALLCANERNASVTNMIGMISGFRTDTALVGMDYRVQDGELYAVGNKGGVYIVNTTNASLTPVNRLTPELNGSLFGVDFNPAANRLRVISDAGQNLRHDVTSQMDNRTATDSNLNTGAGMPPAAVVGVTSTAYTNNDLQPSTATTMFVINSTADTTAIQSPANSGIVVNTGALGVKVSGPVGFDIYSTLRDGAAISNKALASATPEGEATARLYSVNLLTGVATQASSFARNVKVIDIAIPLNQRTDD